MASRIVPGIGLKAFWALGEDNYKSEMDTDLLTLSVLTQGRVISKVAATPGGPTDGDIHLFDETHATQPNKIAVRDNGAWVYLTPLTGWMMYNVATGKFERFNGTAWSAFNGVTQYIVPFFFAATPLASEILLIHVAGDAFTLPANLAGILQSYVGTNPTATFALDIKKNGATIATISVSTLGVVTATTVGGTTKSIAAGDVITVIGPAGADATAANMSFTVIGAR